MGETPAADSMAAARSSITPWGNALYGEARVLVRARLQRHAASVSAWCYVPGSSEARDAPASPSRSNRDTAARKLVKLVLRSGR